MIKSERLAGEVRAYCADITGTTDDIKEELKTAIEGVMHYMTTELGHSAGEVEDLIITTTAMALKEYKTGYVKGKRGGPWRR